MAVADGSVIAARLELSNYNLGRPFTDYSCPSCGADFNVTDAASAHAYNHHAEDCKLLREDSTREPNGQS